MRWILMIMFGCVIFTINLPLYESPPYYEATFNSLDIESDPIIDYEIFTTHSHYYPKGYPTIPVLRTNYTIFIQHNLEQWFYFNWSLFNYSIYAIYLTDIYDLPTNYSLILSLSDLTKEYDIPSVMNDYQTRTQIQTYADFYIRVVNCDQTRIQYSLVIEAIA